MRLTKSMLDVLSQMYEAGPKARLYANAKTYRFFDLHTTPVNADTPVAVRVCYHNTLTALLDNRLLVRTPVRTKQASLRPRVAYGLVSRSRIKGILTQKGLI